MFEGQITQREEVPELTQAEWDFMAAITGYYKVPYFSKDFFTRPIITTSFDGNYGQAGVVITINGSPPRFYSFVLGKSDTQLYRVEFYIPTPKREKFVRFVLSAYDRETPKVILARAIFNLLKERNLIGQ